MCEVNIVITICQLNFSVLMSVDALKIWNVLDFLIEELAKSRRNVVAAFLKIEILKILEYDECRSLQRNNSANKTYGFWMQKFVLCFLFQRGIQENVIKITRSVGIIYNHLSIINQIIWINKS